MGARREVCMSRLLKAVERPQRGASEMPNSGGRRRHASALPHKPNCARCARTGRSSYSGIPTQVCPHHKAVVSVHIHKRRSDLPNLAKWPRSASCTPNRTSYRHICRTIQLRPAVMKSARDHARRAISAALRGAGRPAACHARGAVVEGLVCPLASVVRRAGTAPATSATATPGKPPVAKPLFAKVREVMMVAWKASGESLLGVTSRCVPRLRRR